MKVTLSVDVDGLAEALKQARLSSSKSPTEIAFLAGMSVANLYRIESEDNKSIPLETLESLSDVLGVDLVGDVIVALRDFIEAKYGDNG